jgi:hypothetical protein
MLTYAAQVLDRVANEAVKDNFEKKMFASFDALFNRHKNRCSYSCISPHTSTCVPILDMCPHTTTYAYEVENVCVCHADVCCSKKGYVSSYHYIRVLTHYYVSVLILVLVNYIYTHRTWRMWDNLELLF